MQPDQDYTKQDENTNEFRHYDYEFPSGDETGAKYNPDEEPVGETETSVNALTDENEDLRKQNDQLKSSLGVWRGLGIVFGILSLLGIGYIFYSHFSAPLFGPVAREHEAFLGQTDELKKFKNKADTLQKANDLLVEQQPEIEEGVFFEVQLGAFQDFNLDQYQADLLALRQEGDATRKFTFGRFRDYAQAEKLKNDLQRMGVSGAFVVARVNGQRVEDIQAAIKESKSR